MLADETLKMTLPTTLAGFLLVTLGSNQGQRSKIRSKILGLRAFPHITPTERIGASIHDNGPLPQHRRPIAFHRRRHSRISKSSHYRNIHFFLRAAACVQNHERTILSPLPPEAVDYTRGSTDTSTMLLQRRGADQRSRYSDMKVRAIYTLQGTPALLIHPASSRRDTKRRTGSLHAEPSSVRRH